MSSVGYVVAFGGGVISFLSPCVLPLVPAYLSVITGVDAKDIVAGTPKRQVGHVVIFTILFILGFSIVFISLGLTATTLGRTLFQNHLLINRISGGFLFVMALFLLGSMAVRLPWLYREKRFHPNFDRFGGFAAPVAGMAFGFGWTPCIGPILTSVLAVAATQGHAVQGAGLLASYSLGLGLPFLATGVAFAKLAGAFAWIKRHFDLLTLLSSLTLALFGVLLMTNHFSWMTIHLQQLVNALGLGSLNRIG